MSIANLFSQSINSNFCSFERTLQHYELASDKNISGVAIK